MTVSALGRELDDDPSLRALLESLRQVAVLGIKPESQAGAPAHYVARYLVDVGLELWPVPVYFPELTRILGRPVHRRVADLPARMDLVNVFRRSKDLMPHLDDLIAARPRAVWLQLGIRDDGFAEALRRHGIDVVQDRCLMVEHRRLLGPAWR